MEMGNDGYWRLKIFFCPFGCKTSVHWRFGFSSKQCGFARGFGHFGEDNGLYLWNNSIYKTCKILPFDEIKLIPKNFLPNMMSSYRRNFSFLLLIPSIIQQIGLSSGCTPAGSGCCSSPRPASCGNLPPCSPGSMSASHLSRL